MAFFLGWLGRHFYLQAGLEGTGHDLVVGPGAAEQQQVDIEEQQVHEDGDDQQGHRSGEQVTQHTDLPEMEGTSPLLWGRRAQVCPPPRPVIRCSLPPDPPGPASPCPGRQHLRLTASGLLSGARRGQRQPQAPVSM